MSARVRVYNTQCNTIFICIYSQKDRQCALPVITNPPNGPMVTHAVLYIIYMYIYIYINY